jgi:hypothetical protein
MQDMSLGYRRRRRRITMNRRELLKRLMAAGTAALLVPKVLIGKSELRTLKDGLVSHWKLDGGDHVDCISRWDRALSDEEIEFLDNNGTSVPYDQWNHIVTEVRNGQDIAVYINGRKVQ